MEDADDDDSLALATTDWPQIEAYRAVVAKCLDDGLFNTQKQPALVGHYTGTKAAQRILSERALRLTNPRCSNDRQEIDQAYSVSAKTLETNAPKELAELVTFWMTHSGFEHYVGCFTSFDSVQEADDINLWQAYGDDGRGVALIFDFPRLVHDLRAPGYGDYIISRVTYDIGVLEAVIRNLVAETLPRWAAEPEEWMKAAYAQILGSAIQKICAFFKDPCFKYEKEVRILRLGVMGHEVNFYECDDFLAPYITMPHSIATSNNPELFVDTDGALKGCLIGPSADQQRMSTVVASTLFSLEHEDPRRAVFLSTKPYRSLRVQSGHP